MAAAHGPSSQGHRLRRRVLVHGAGLLALAGLAVARTVLARSVIRGTPAGAVPDVVAGTPRRGSSSPEEVTVLVAVRSGDPLLPLMLQEQAAGLAPAQVLLLVDDDDRAGEEAARAVERRFAHVQVVVCPPPAPATNPKVHKLALVQDRCRDVVVLLDDDTVLAAGALARLVAGLDGAALATGIPVYRDSGGVWSRLVAAFVNSSALPTYLAQAALGPPVSVNGMVVATRRRDLERIGGFTTLLGATCDDYALALRYRRHGLGLVQLAVPARLATTVDDGAAYLLLMRRWMLFAEQVVRRDASPRLVSLVVVPSVLPAAVLAAAIGTGPAAVGATLAVLGAQAWATRSLRREIGAPPERPSGLVLEVLAVLLAPAHLVTAVLGPRHVVWRGRRVRVGVGELATVGPPGAPGASRSPGAPGAPDAPDAPGASRSPSATSAPDEPSSPSSPAAPRRDTRLP